MTPQLYLKLSRQIARQQPELADYQAQIAAAQPGIDAAQAALDAATATAAAVPNAHTRRRVPIRHRIQRRATR